LQVVARVYECANHSAGHAYYSRVRRNGANHHRPGADLGAVSNRDIAKNLGARADHDVVSDGRVALAFFFAGSAQRHALIEQYVVTDLRGLADHHAHAMVDKTAAPDGRARVDL